jgi:tight adherence protein B
VNIVFIALVIFIGSLLIIEMLVYASKMMRKPDSGQIRKRLKNLYAYEQKPGSVDIERKRIYSEVKILNRILGRMPGIHLVDRLLQQAGSGSSLGSFLLLSIGLCLCGYFLANFFRTSWETSIGAGIFLGSLPHLNLVLKKKRRMAKFEKQLPDALELMGRALRAGHAFTNGVKLAAEEFGDPVGPEFEKTLAEINFGVSVPDALREMTRRTESPDLKFFVVAVILQRETGGNLAEIIDSIAYIIRERFKLRGKIKILAAEGKLSAIILVALPFLIAGYIRIVNPEYLDFLLTRTAGQVMLAGACIMMAAGIVVIKKMINIKV